MTLATYQCSNAMAGNTDLSLFTQANTNFALKLFQYAASNPKANAFMSPASITIALAMTYAGSDGQTKAELRSTLFGDYGQDDSEIHKNMKQLVNQLNEPAANRSHFQLLIANRLYGQQAAIGDFQKSFTDLLSAYYEADTKSVDFGSDAARMEINDWVSEKTTGKIKDLIPTGTLTPLTRLVIVNAIYFKGNWKYRFEPEATIDSDFYIGESDQDVRKLPMMYLGERKLPYAENEELQLVGLPYGGTDEERVFMYILLPRERNGLEKMKRSLSDGNVTKLVLSARNEKVRVGIPKFKLDEPLDLAEALKTLGAKDMFVGGKADFSKMNGKRNLFISNVLHKAYIDVNEEGTEAAAATAVVSLTRALLSMEFFADHPFMFAIIDKKSMSVLFLGQYAGV